MMTKPNPSSTNGNHIKVTNGHGSYVCHHCSERFEHKFELSLHVAALHHAAGKYSPSEDKKAHNR